MSLEDLKHIKIEESWKEALQDEFRKPYFDQIRSFLQRELKAGKVIYPPGSQIFNAFNYTPFDKLKVVIIGQDPYHNPGAAMGLCFSVPKGMRIPPSLLNIYKEMNTNLGIPIAKHGDLTSWAKQGVFLLNAMLTVEQSKAGSHQKIGWQQFTNAVIKTISDQKKGVIFLLWGKFAQKKKELIDDDKHTIMEAPHPSPLARGGFFGNKHFSQTNNVLIAQNTHPIHWQLPD